jgi:hypothetical protein
MDKPGFTLDKIKFATDGPTFEKAVKLYESGKVTCFDDNGITYTATVRGTQLYDALVSRRRYDEGHCTCYLGQNDTLCKHMVALAIYAVQDGKPLTIDDKKQVHNPACSGRLGNLSGKEFLTAKQTITACLRYIKPYNGPSRIWFAYQGSLSEGCNRLSAIVSDLPVGEQTSELLIDLLLRLDKKLTTGGVDDSDGTVGGFIEETVGVLQEFAKLDSGCVKSFAKLQDRETCFGWEEPLLKSVDSDMGK